MFLMYRKFRENEYIYAGHISQCGNTESESYSAMLVN